MNLLLDDQRLRFEGLESDYIDDRLNSMRYSTIFLLAGVTDESVAFCCKIAMRRVEQKINQTIAGIQYAQQSRSPWKGSIMLPASRGFENVSQLIAPHYWMPRPYTEESWFHPSQNMRQMNREFNMQQHPDHQSETEPRTERRNDAQSEATPLAANSTNTSKLKSAWRNKWYILQAFLTLHLSTSRKVRATIATRRSICKSNACGHYDKYGTTEKVVIRGKPACDLCGCNTLLLCSYLPGECSLSKEGIEPMWKGVIMDVWYVRLWKKLEDFCYRIANRD